MTDEIIKICKKHGELTRIQVIKKGISHSEQQYRCKLCMKEFHRINYLKNKEKILQRTSLYRKNNLEKYKEYKKKYKINKEVIEMTITEFRKTRIAKRKLVYLLWDIDKVIRKNENK